MKIRNLLLVLFGVVIWSPPLSADDFPASYVAQQLANARKPIEVSLTNIEPGQLSKINYVDRPVWVYRRTNTDIEYLSGNNSSHLADPYSANMASSIEASYYSSSSHVWARLLLVDQPEIEKLPYRSRNKKFFVVGAWSPHSGCEMSLVRPENRSNKYVAFYDPCSGASFDVAGRILKGPLTGNAVGVSDRYNMYIPPYTLKDDETLVIGIRESKKLPDIQISKERRYLNMAPTQMLVTAARHDDHETVKLALKDGADARYNAAENVSPLDAAIIGSSMEVIYLLIANGARPTPISLTLATSVGRAEVIELIEWMQQ